MDTVYINVYIYILLYAQMLLSAHNFWVCEQDILCAMSDKIGVCPLGERVGYDSFGTLELNDSHHIA